MINNEGVATIRCTCDKGNIIEIKPNGQFLCWGWQCGVNGHIDDYPDIKKRYSALKAQLAERFGQLRLPGF